MEIIRAHIKDGIVVNLSVGNTYKPWTPPIGITIVEVKGDEAAIGYSYDGKEFKAPALVEPLPQAPTLEERLALLEQEVIAIKVAQEKIS